MSVTDTAAARTTPGADAGAGKDSGRRNRADGGPHSPIALLGRAGRRALAALAVVAAIKAVALVLVAESLATGIVSVIDGDDRWRGALVLGLAGAALRGLCAWAARSIAQRASLSSKAELRQRLAERAIAGGVGSALGGGSKAVSGAAGATGATGAGGAGGASGATQRTPAGTSAGGGMSVGALTTLATRGLDDLDGYFVQFLPALVGAAVVPIAVGARIFAADWLSAVIIALTIPLVPLFMVLIGRHSSDAVDRAADALLRLSHHLVELAKGLPVLVGLGRLAPQTTALDRLSREYRARTMRTLRTAFMSSLAMELIATISVALVAVAIGLRLVSGELGLEVGLLVLILAPDCYAPIREAGAAYHASEDGVAALRRADRVTWSPAPVPLWARDGRAAAAPEPEPEGTGMLRVDALTVRYEGRADAVGEVSFTARAGEATLLAGPSGVGKSTAIAAIAGRLGAPGDEGCDGVRSGASRDPHQHRGEPRGAGVAGTLEGVDPDAIAWVPQHPRATADLVLDELARHARADAPRAREHAVAVLGELGIAHLASAQTHTLSPGELRRVAVARALVRVDEGATLLLLDEPTAHLDAPSADLVRATIARRLPDVTAVVASHDPAVHAMCARHVELRRPAGANAAAGSVASPSAPAREAATTADECVARKRGAIASASVTVITGATANTNASANANVNVNTGATADADERPELDARQSLTPTPRRPLAPEPRPLRAPAAARLLASVLGPARWRFALAVLLGVLATGFGVAQTAVSGWLTVRAAEQPPIMLLLVAIVGVRFFGLGRSVLRYAERLQAHDAVFVTAGALRGRLWRVLADAGLRVKRLRSGPGALELLVGDVDRLRDQLPRFALPPFVAAASMAGLVAAAALMAPWAVAPLVVLAVAGLVVAPAVAALADRTASAREQLLRSALARRFGTLLEGADELAVHRVAHRPLADLARLEAGAAAGAGRAALAQGIAGGIVALATGATAVLLVAAAATSPTHVDGGILAVFALATLALGEPLAEGVSAVHRWRAARVALDVVGDVLGRATASPSPGSASSPRSPASARAKSAPVADRIAPPLPVAARAAALEVHDAAAQWPGTDAPVFDGLSLRVRETEWLTVTGPSGSGKSTLLALLLGHLPPARGRVLIGGLPADARRAGAIAWCPQDAHLFDSTLRANLALAVPPGTPATDARLGAALRRVGLGDWLAGLPDGLDTRVGAGGSRLSGGQRQRVAVARALLTGASVVLLDEPTAHLDAEGAERLIADLREALASRAVVCVTHDAVAQRPGDLRLRLPLPRSAGADKTRS